ncbi:MULTISPECIES: hypothetical protein [Brucella]|uniref:Bme3 n=3 Tax=Brucella melitensis TaxID=29459 RepID=C0RKW9_BRUMB|nr:MULTISPECIES: hypothetical protein [Brucella]EXU84920.1 hypothetical protein AX23_00285 [Brucella melitensis 548]AAL54084.1 hypothetical protein BMEII0842 [Brucella melitensis bv. 1 str. 16M]ACO02252.1 Hypothetical protein, conserved [Brucella melitensis ATCC 23457]ADZ67648.1 conserved hypothetical protein [Brucella melitensis M28]ADZ88514.1 conserved hypothetical protein [Brucella melitensis M5-90]
MNLSLTWIFAGLVLCILATGFLSRPERMYQFPFLAGVMTFGFILPQLPALVNDPFFPDGAYAKTMTMGIFSLAMLALGWSLTRKPIRLLSMRFSERRLLRAAAGLSIFGAIFYFLLSRLPGDISIGTQMTGMPVVYLFFAQLMPYGLGIALLCYARKSSWFAATIILFDLVFYLDRILVTGKRAEAIQLLLMFLLAFWFYRRMVVPRIVMFLGILTGTFLMTSMGDYRHVTRAASGFVLDQILDIDYAANFNETLERGGPEMRNAVQRIDELDRRLEFDYGKFHWNRIVFTFVPAQLVGGGVKASLYLDTPKPSREYNPPTGTTDTGLVDAFASFWYFGALKFLLLAWMIRRLWETAMAGEMLGQLLYMFSIVPAMHAISHQTDWVVPVWIHMALFLIPILSLCVIRNRSVYLPMSPQLS